MFIITVLCRDAVRLPLGNGLNFHTCNNISTDLPMMMFSDLGRRDNTDILFSRSKWWLCDDVL